MAQQTKKTEQKRGPGRPPGSKNKPKNTGTKSNGPTRQEVIDEMHRRNERDRRNNDVIWGITLFAVGLFLFFTVVMDSTGSFGGKVHDICYGLFGIMALLLPFLVFAYAVLLIAHRVRHIGGGTAICSLLIFVNMCVLNSYRFIDSKDIHFGFKDIGSYYLYGVKKQSGGAVGMEIASILAKLFGKPGLLIIAITVLLICIFLVANTPISRFAAKASKKRDERRMIRELEREESSKITDDKANVPAAQTSGASVSAASGARSIWSSLLGLFSKEDEHTEEGTPDIASYPDPTAAIPEPFGSKREKEKERPAETEYTQIIKSPFGGSDVKMSRDTLFGRIKDYFGGIDSETGETVTASTLDGKSPQSVGLDGGKPVRKSIYSDGPGFDNDDEDFGYPGRKRVPSAPSHTGLGLGDPDDVGHSGSYGLDAHGGAKTSRPAEPKKKTAASSSPKKAEADKTVSEGVPAEVSSDDAKIAEGFNTVTEDLSYELPPVSLLKRDSSSKQMMSDMQLQERADLLERTLMNFGVEARVLNVTQGASVTRFEVQPATGVKVAKITGLSDDIALNLRAKSIRIEAPIPGKAAVGIEVENEKPSPVLVRDLIESDEFRNASSIIEFVVGKDISGNNIVADLTDMPHLLIAGATGSGKSVCINSIITSFLYKARPSELKMIMIDPKMVELGNYNGIPHMLTPVVTDPRKAARALAIAVDEMEKRYELFAENNVKDLHSFNQLMRIDQRYADCKPQIVIIIDELADLMMASPSEVETSICRLAQKARAAGLHLIVATQRPSADVVTGLIKANIPSRIAFSVASALDSRIILDMQGAEKLLGKGDMLFSPVGSTKPLRVQGPYISEKEIDKVIKFVKKEGGTPEYDEEVKSAIENADKKTGSGPQDELTEDAIAFIFKSKQASVSMLQRRFRIGYNRAARIIDEIEEKGIIGPSDGSRPRQLLITEDEYYGGSGDTVSEPEPAEEPEPAVTFEPEPVYEPEPEMAPEDDGMSPSGKLSNTRAMDSFNSLPESVRRMVMDADSESDY